MCVGGGEHAHICAWVCMNAHVSMNHACVMCSGETGTCVQVRKQLCGVHSPAGDGTRVTRPEELQLFNGCCISPTLRAFRVQGKGVESLVSIRKKLACMKTAGPNKLISMQSVCSYRDIKHFKYFFFFQVLKSQISKYMNWFSWEPEQYRT